MIENSELIIQFRSQESSLDQEVIDLVKAVHGSLVPRTYFLDKMSNSSVSIWEMEHLAKRGYLTMASDTISSHTLNLIRCFCF